LNPAHNAKETCMHRITDCNGSEDDRLWVRFDDGMEGTVFLGHLLETGAFRQWRDVSQFCGVVVDPAAATVVWESGIRFDPGVLYQDLLTTRAGKEFSGSGLAPAVE
jgi:hypothetical protein